MIRHAIKSLWALFFIFFPWIVSHGQESARSLATSASSVYAAERSSFTLKPEPGARRKLRVVMYPIIPAFTDYMFQIKAGFEDSADGKDIQIEFQDLTLGYYDPKDKNFIESAQADVYEIDSVFLADFASLPKIQELPGQLVPKDGEFLANAQHAGQLDGKWYGVPHWVCGNLLFFQKDDTALASVRTLADLQNMIGATHQAGSGLFIDLKGKSTLGEFYLMSLFDRYQSFPQVQSHLAPYDNSIESDLKRAGSLCDPGFCRNGNYHNAIGFYPSQFARRRARALVGYSESLYYVLWEAQNACAQKDKCYTDTDLRVAEIPLDDKGSKQMSWVDLLTIDKNCNPQCVSDATAFISFVNSHATQVQALTGYPPRYLLPARASVYGDAAVQKAAPLYQQIRPIIEKAETPTALNLDQTLRTYGNTLDQNLPAPPAP